MRMPAPLLRIFDRTARVAILTCVFTATACCGCEDEGEFGLCQVSGTPGTCVFVRFSDSEDNSKCESTITVIIGKLGKGCIWDCSSVCYYSETTCH